MKRYWTAQVTYDGKRPFLFHANVFCIADSELAAEPMLQVLVADAWAKISPHPAPRLLAVLDGRLILCDEN